MKVLLLESDKKQADTFTAMLRGCEVPAEVVTATSLVEAQTVLANGDVTLLVLDVETPAASSVEFLKALRQNGDWTPACVYTDIDSKTILEAMSGYNCLTRLDKGLGMEAVGSKIKDMLYLASDEATEQLTSIETIAEDIQTAIQEGESKLNGLE